MQITRQFFLVAMLLPFFLVGCDDNVSDPTDLPPEPSVDSTVSEEVQAFKNQMKQNLQEMQQQINRLAERADTLGADAKDQAQLAVEDLSDRREALSRRIDALSADSAEAWADTKDEVTKSWNELRDGLESVSNRFRNDNATTPDAGQ